MSRECCGPDEPARSSDGRPTLSLLETPSTKAGRSDVASGHTPDDDCCGPRAVSPEEPLTYEELTPWWRDRTLLLPVLSGVLLVASLMVGRLDAERVQLSLEIGSLAAGAWTFVPGALRRLRNRRLGVGLLMTIAAVGAVALGRFGEAAALAFLFSIAEALEERAMDKAQHGLRALLALIPDTAKIERRGHEEFVKAVDLEIGDILVVGAGERVSTDGVVEEGASSLDTSAITGESIPVAVGPRDEVSAGSVNGSGTLRIRATAAGTDNSLTQIVRLVEQAHARKGDRARLADRIARPLVPGVLLLSASVALLGLLTDAPGMWLERALVVLVAASPCAMAIAVPVTVISAIGSASRLGVVIKSGQAFEQLGTVTTVALDKTGTLTRNQPEVVAVATAKGFSRDRVLGYAAALEATSTHPLAEAVRVASSAAAPATGVEERAGHGVVGTVEGRVVRVGSPRWVAPTGLQQNAEDMAAQGMSIVVVEVDDQIAGVIGIRDELRPEAAEAVSMLRERGIDVLMVTGDNQRTTEALAREAGITDVRAEQLPADKANEVAARAEGVPTAMIGDGINDAPALAAATVGIAMGVTGSAAAVESADVAFTGHDLRQIPLALDHARRGRRIMTGNIGLALAIIVVLVPLALVGTLGLAEVVLVHELAEVLVILNGLRAARVRRDAATARPAMPTTPGAPQPAATSGARR
ncbi:cadmium-translocating P-type ATPase [Nocardioidaceae bacterium]|nr:cadmium-translocating P-type ATPase [Nocardioidaceae bacterium]